MRALEQPLLVERPQVRRTVASLTASSRGQVGDADAAGRRQSFEDRPKRSALRTRGGHAATLCASASASARPGWPAVPPSARVDSAPQAHPSAAPRAARRRRARRRGTGVERVPGAGRVDDRDGRRRRAHDLPAGEPDGTRRAALERHERAGGGEGGRRAPRRFRPRRAAPPPARWAGHVHRAERRRHAAPALLGVPPRVRETVAPAAWARATNSARPSRRRGCRNGEATWTWRARASSASGTAVGSSSPSAPRAVRIARSSSRASATLKPVGMPASTCTARCRRRLRQRRQREAPQGVVPDARHDRGGQAQPRRAAGHDRAGTTEHERRLVDDCSRWPNAGTTSPPRTIRSGFASPMTSRSIVTRARRRAARRRARRSARRTSRAIVVEVERRGRVGIEHRRVVDVVAAALSAARDGELDHVEERPVQRGAAGAAARRRASGCTPVAVDQARHLDARARRAGCRSGRGW